MYCRNDATPLYSAGVRFGAVIVHRLAPPITEFSGSGRTAGSKGSSASPQRNLAFFATSARTPEDMAQVADVTTSELRAAHAQVFGVIVNRADPDALGTIVSSVERAVHDDHPDLPVWAIPEDSVLVAPTVRALLAATDATFVRGDEALLDREAMGTVVAGMSMENVLPRLIEGGAKQRRADPSAPVEPQTAV